MELKIGIDVILLLAVLLVVGELLLSWFIHSVGVSGNVVSRDGNWKTF